MLFNMTLDLTVSENLRQVADGLFAVGWCLASPESQS